jgi:hypothetical protein
MHDRSVEQAALHQSEWPVCRQKYRAFLANHFAVACVYLLVATLRLSKPMTKWVSAPSYEAVMVRLWVDSVHELFAAKRIADQQTNRLSGYPLRL